MDEVLRLGNLRGVGKGMCKVLAGVGRSWELLPPTGAWLLTLKEQLCPVASEHTGGRMRRGRWMPQLHSPPFYLPPKSPLSRADWKLLGREPFDAVHRVSWGKEQVGHGGKGQIGNPHAWLSTLMGEVLQDNNSFSSSFTQSFGYARVYWSVHHVALHHPLFLGPPTSVTVP